MLRKGLTDKTPAGIILHYKVMKPRAKSPTLSKCRALYCNKNPHVSISHCCITYAFTVYPCITHLHFIPSLNTGFDSSGAYLSSSTAPPSPVNHLLSSSRTVKPQENLPMRSLAARCCCSPHWQLRPVNVVGAVTHSLFDSARFA